MILHCPLCHAAFSIEALIQDQAGRELLALFANKATPSLLPYLSLFRSEKRALAFDRALKLAKEALQLGDPAQLEAAMAETVESMRSKREQGQGKPLKNHNYLKRVLESTTASPVTALATVEEGAQRSAAKSKTATAIGRLESWKRG